MKRKGIIAVCLFLALGGCTRSKTPYEIAVGQSEKIIEAVVDKDTEALKEMFSEYTKSTHDLDKEIEGFLNFIDGKIVSYDTPDGDVRSKSTTPEGTKEVKLGGKIRNIKTDSGRTYQIGFNYYYIYSENADYLGITFIGIQDIDTYDEETGYPDEGVSTIGEVIK